MACGCNDEAGVGRTVQCLHGALHSMYSDGTCGRVQGKHENAAFGRIEFVDGTAISLGSYRYCRISFHFQFPPREGEQRSVVVWAVLARNSPPWISSSDSPQMPPQSSYRRRGTEHLPSARGTALDRLDCFECKHDRWCQKNC